MRATDAVLTTLLTRPGAAGLGNAGRCAANRSRGLLSEKRVQESVAHRLCPAMQAPDLCRQNCESTGFSSGRALLRTHSAFPLFMPGHLDGFKLAFVRLLRIVFELGQLSYVAVQVGEANG